MKPSGSVHVRVRISDAEKWKKKWEKKRIYFYNRVIYTSETVNSFRFSGISNTSKFRPFVSTTTNLVKKIPTTLTNENRNMQPYKSNLSIIAGNIFNIMNAKTLTDDMQIGPPIRLICGQGNKVSLFQNLIAFPLAYTFCGNTSDMMMYGIGIIPIELI